MLVVRRAQISFRFLVRVWPSHPKITLLIYVTVASSGPRLVSYGQDRTMPTYMELMWHGCILFGVSTVL